MAEVVFQGNQITQPQWAGDFLNREHLVPGGAKADPTAFPATDAQDVVLSANASSGATSIAFAALVNPIPSGTLLNFGVGKYARTTAPAAAGATTVAVEALPAGLSSGDKASYLGVGRKTIQSGAFVSRTIAQRDAGTGFHPAISTDDEFYLVPFEVTDAAKDADIDLYRHTSIVKENFLPGITAILANSGLLAKLRANYTCTKGAN